MQSYSNGDPEYKYKAGNEHKRSPLRINYLGPEPEGPFIFREKRNEVENRMNDRKQR